MILKTQTSIGKETNVDTGNKIEGNKNARYIHKYCLITMQCFKLQSKYKRYECCDNKKQWSLFGRQEICAKKSSADCCAINL